MASHHSSIQRGLLAAGSNPENVSQSRFGRMFPGLKPATFGNTPEEVQKALGKLADAMVSPFDPPKDGPDDEESGIPALYTYLGQFVDHDLSFGPEGSFQKQQDPDATEDFRTAAFDLDNVYGRGPGDQPYLYDTDGKTLLLGNALTLGAPGARDLQRNAAGRALIGDPRNDENAIVSQFQGLFVRFHNRVVADNPAVDFETCQGIVRDHYQYMLMHDFLTRIVNKSVLDELRTPGGAYDKTKLKFFKVCPIPFIPIEFATAAYRLGHSMIRPGYRLNDATLLPIFPLPPHMVPGFPEGLTGFRKTITDWGIDWGRFIDIDVRDYGTQTLDPDPKKAAVQTAQNFKRLQFAYRIDTAIVDPLGSLPLTVAGNQPLSLSLRNLLRSSQFGLPSGQTVAAAMNLIPLEDKDIFIGQGTDVPDPDRRSIDSIDPIFTKNCPLWTYILAEAMHHLQAPVVNAPVNGGVKITTPQLGPVGGRIVAEVFLGLMFSDPGSIFNTKPTWTPNGNAGYALKDFVKHGLGL